MANKIIKTLNAQSYTGNYEASIGGNVVSGTLNTDGKKELNNIYGSVNEGDKLLANFNAYRNGEEFSYNFSEIHDIEALPAIVAAIKETVAAIQEELNA